MAITVRMPEADNARLEVGRILREENDFLVAAHYSPDGDAIGSTAALGWLLEGMGKRFTLYNASPMPRQFDWLPMPSALTSTLPEQPAARYFVLDSGDERRMGTDLQQAIDLGRTVAIDHHLENPHFGAVNWVETNRSSVGEMIGELARDLSVPLEGPLAEAIYLAICTDTGNFAYSNTSARVLEMAAEIVRHGLDPARINARINNQWSPGRIRLWSRVLGAMEMCFQDRVGVIRISKSDLAATGTDSEDTDGLINTVRSIRGLKVAVSLRDDGAGQIKFSLRSHGDTNVQAVAVRFGGGGHRNAAGGMIPGSMDEAGSALLAAVALMPELAVEPGHGIVHTGCKQPV